MEATFRSETAGKPIKCKAAVCRGAGQSLVIEDIEVAPPKAGEVRIKILCTSVCHTDITFWKSDRSVGEEVEYAKEGDFVVPVAHRNCEECRDCKISRGNGCTKFPYKFFHVMPRDGTSRFKDTHGQPLNHFMFVSSFAQYTVVDVMHLVKISAQVPVEQACLLSCGVTTGVGATMKAAEVDEGSTVAIFGLGTVGLAVATGAKIRGASKIIGIDNNPEKFEIGKKFGVTDFVNPNSCGKDSSVSQVILEMTNGGADYCFECVGLVSLMKEAYDCCRPGCGKTVILGGDTSSTPLSINPFELLMGRCIMGSSYGGVKPKQDIPRLAQMYLDKELDLDGFITHEVKFEDINKAFDLLLQGKSLRCIIWMDK